MHQNLAARDPGPGSIRYRNTDVEKYRDDHQIPDFTWSYDDVARLLPDLNDEQGADVLSHIFDNYDHQRGIDDDLFIETGNLLFPSRDVSNNIVEISKKKLRKRLTEEHNQMYVKNDIENFINSLK